jgi:hypothetical protein
MGRETSDQAAFAGLHSITKLLQVLTTVDSESRSRRCYVGQTCRRQLALMGRETSDQAAITRLHAITKLLQVLATVHAKSRGAAPCHWLRGGRLSNRRLPGKRIVSLGKSRRSNNQKGYSDLSPPSDIVRHLVSSITPAYPAVRSLIPNWSSFGSSGGKPDMSAVGILMCSADVRFWG